MSISENDDQPSTSGYLKGYPAEDDQIGDLPASVQRRRKNKYGLTIFSMFFNDSKLGKHCPEFFFVRTSGSSECLVLWLALGRFAGVRNNIVEKSLGNWTSCFAGCE